MNATTCQDENLGITKASAMSIVFGLDYKKLNETIPHKWIHEAEIKMKEMQKDAKYWEFFYTSSYGLSNEVERGTLTTMTKLVVSIILVIIMLIFAFHENSYIISIQLALLAMGCVLIAAVMGLGFSLLVGLPWTTITPVIVFLAIGLGVDNMVLLTILVYRGDKNHSLQHRLVHAGNGMGVGIQD